MINLSDDLLKIKKASYKLATIDTDLKNKILENIINSLSNNKKRIIAANELDVKAAIDNNIKDAFIDRLKLDEKRIDALSESIKELIKLDDPVGKVIANWTTVDGINIKKVSVPFGVLCVIYEARPNVTVDIAAMALKTSNACVLRGGKEAFHTNKCLVELIKLELKKYDLEDCVYLVSDNSHELVDQLLSARGLIDLVIPRGGKGLIEHVVKNASVPVIETGAGTCHVYVHQDASFYMALNIIVNAKVQRPSVCNACECVLVDEKIKDEFLPLLYQTLNDCNVLLKGDKEVKKIIDCELIENDEEYKIEYNDLILNIKIVKDYLDAINHINNYSTHHSDCVVTNNKKVADAFLKNVDSACVYHNASTRFSDGGCFGFGAEVGISTQKLHARGPMGLAELTSYKYIVEGNGEVRK